MTPATPAVETSLVNQAPAPVVEPYTPFDATALQVPEGFTLDEGSMNTFLGVMNNRELTPVQQAQSLLELQANLTTKSSEAGSQAWKDEQAAWQAEISADPVLGGANLTQTLTGIGNLMDRFANDDVRAAFDRTGAGNNPHIVRFLSTLVSQLKEPAPLDPGKPGNGGAPRSLADRIYGS